MHLADLRARRGNVGSVCIRGQRWGSTQPQREENTFKLRSFRSPESCRLQSCDLWRIGQRRRAADALGIKWLRVPARSLAAPRTLVWVCSCRQVRGCAAVLCCAPRWRAWERRRWRVTAFSPLFRSMISFAWFHRVNISAPAAAIMAEQAPHSLVS